MAELPDILDKQALLAAIRSERAQLDGIFDRIEDARMLSVVRADGWTAKDMLAHITAWEERLLRWIGRWRAAGDPRRPEPGVNWDGGVDALNARDYETARVQSVAEVRARAADARARVVAAVQSLGEADLTVPSSAWDGLTLSWIVRANTDEHYREHREEIEAWLRDHPL